ncbi:MAG TPA: cobalamin-dependent protein [Terriglobales bacterium]|nr:cobalamin-dependent protein [Terriglobales bacterium]
MDGNFAAMRQSIIDGAPENASALASLALAQGHHPLEVIDNGFVPGMAEVGQLFAKHQMFLPDMLAAAEAMKAAMAVLEPALKRQGEERPFAGTVILGTTKGDIHEIGKTLVGTLLTANGFKVYDLGVDVSGDQFAGKAREWNADIVGVSALLTTTMRGQKGVVEALERAELRPSVKIIVGGAPVTQRWAEEIGADGYAKDAISAVALVKSLLEHKLTPAAVTL